MNALAVVGSIFMVLAAVIHLLIFVMESVLWARPATWRRFGLRSQDDADTVAPMAYNQGFYNLFLAIGAVIGVVLLYSPGWSQAGAALAIFATASMLLAAVVLVSSSPKLLRAALIQGVAPVLGIAFLLLGLA